MTLFAWHVPDGYLGDPDDDGDTHESVCLTNDTGEPADVVFTAFFADRPARRCDGLRLGPLSNRHVRTDSELLRPLGLRRGDPYGLRVESDTHLHLQYSRLVQTGGQQTLMTTVLVAVRPDAPEQERG